MQLLHVLVLLYVLRVGRKWDKSVRNQKNLSTHRFVVFILGSEADAELGLPMYLWRTRAALGVLIQSNSHGELCAVLSMASTSGVASLTPGPFFATSGLKDIVWNAICKNRVYNRGVKFTSKLFAAVRTSDPSIDFQICLQL